MSSLASREESHSQSADTNSTSGDWKKHVPSSLSKQKHPLRKSARQLIVGGCAGICMDNPIFFPRPVRSFGLKSMLIELCFGHILLPWMSDISPLFANLNSCCLQYCWVSSYLMWSMNESVCRVSGGQYYAPLGHHKDQVGPSKFVQTIDRHVRTR